jgi:hypothetical protein
MSKKKLELPRPWNPAATQLEINKILSRLSKNIEEFCQPKILTSKFHNDSHKEALDENLRKGIEQFYLNYKPGKVIQHDAGVKHDQDKPALNLIPSEMLEQLGQVLSFGAKKYGKSNWKKGIEHSRLIAATMRHIAAYNRNEDTDPESGLSHLAHAVCNLSFLIWMKQHKPDLDDRGE